MWTRQRRTHVVAGPLAAAARWIGASTAAVVVGSMLTATPALAAHRHVPNAPRAQAVPVHAVASHARRPPAAPSWKPSTVSWPQGSGEVILSGPAHAATTTPGAKAPTTTPSAAPPPATRASNLPVWLGAAVPGGSMRLRVDLASHTQAVNAGVDGLLLRLDRLDSGGRGAMSVAVDTTPFRDAYGADYASRLRLVTLPACALTTPDLAACRTRTPLASTNDARTGRVSGSVEAPTGGATLVVAATSTPSGGGGDFAATSLQASGSWQAGGSNGGFEWSYPIALPSVPGGLSPQVSLSYASQSVDGLTSATNTQASWIGDGWDYQPGFIERSYQSCQQNPAGATRTGDSCWSSKNMVTLSLNGQSSTLVRDDTTGEWHPQDDNAENVQLLTGAPNGAYSGEHWVVTDAQGVKYYFGQNQLPGYASGDATTNSVWTEPVFATATGQPCYNSTFASSYCANMAYRWNLDYVVDPHSDAVSYFYKGLSGVYARDNGSTANATYTRGGYLVRAQYGQRAGQVYSTKPAAQVLFGVTGRCNQTTCDPATLSSTTAKNWPDVPYDLHCVSGSACSQTSPSFWTEYRLSTIATQALVGTTEQNVDSWALSASFPATGDATAPAMWLDSISRTGQAGTGITLPPVTFTGQLLANRVNLTEGYEPITRRRLQKITTETGEQIGVDYSSAACASGTPGDPSANTTLCYPEYWTPVGQPNPILDWFNKYVVTDVSEQDETAGGLPVKTHYAYQSPAWHRDDGPLTPTANRTWNQWRGFRTVQEFTGQAPDPITESQSTYFQGMNGDALKSGGTRTATVSDSQGDPAVPDQPAFAGMTYEQIVYSGSGGAVVKDTVSTPWQSATTATQAESGLPSQIARMTGVGSVRTYTPLASGGTRVTEVDNTYDGYGRTTQVDDQGDTGTSADDKCTTTTYATNTTAGILDAPDDVRTVSVPCGATPTLPDDLISDVRSYYDGSTTLGAAPTAGDATMTTQIGSYTGSTANWVTTSSVTLDQYGRTTRSVDADNRATTTAYTPATGAEPTQTVVTDAMGHTTTTVIDPRRDLPTSVTDAAGYVTAKNYDALGRAVAQWDPGHPISGSASAKFSYVLSGTGPSTVTTQALNANGGYTTTIDLYDALLRDRETQTATVDGGRTVTDTVYNSAGWKVKTSDDYYVTGAPSATLVAAPDNQTPSQTGYVYDGAGRQIAVIAYSMATETWRTTYAYGGNFTTVVPPAGGTATTTFEDPDGNTTDVYSYHAGVPIDPINDPAADYDHVRYNYTPDGKPASLTDAAGNTWSRTYNLLGQEIGETDPDTGVSSSTYDNAGQSLSDTDARGKTTSYTYDLDGRMTASYDTTGGAAESSANQIAGWTYDTLKTGMPTSSTVYSGGNAYTDATLGYNAYAKPTGTRVTLPAAEGALAPSGGYITQFTYDSVGNLATQTDMAAGGLPQETVSYGHDTFGQPTSVRGIWDYLDNTTYTEFGEPQQYVLGPSTAQVWITLSRDQQTRNTVEAVLGDSTKPGSVDDVTYAYDPSGNVTSSTDTSALGADTQCYTYDYADRLTAAWTGTDHCAATPTPGHSTTVGGPVPYWQSWTFDAAGNRLTETDHDTGGVAANDTASAYHYPTTGGPHVLSSTSATGPNAAAETASLTYDVAGNTTGITQGGAQQTLTWNDQGKLGGDTTSAGASTYLYDADGNLLVRRDPGSTTLFLDDEQIVLSGGTATGTRFYSLGDTEVAARTGSNAVSYLAPDRQGTDTIAIDAATQAVTRRQYLPYGQVRGAAPGAWPGDNGYVGGTIDPATSLENLGAREYDPALGRFLSSDAVLEAADPKEMGGYAYAGNNPVTHSDPSGDMLYDDVTGLGFGNVKGLNDYYHKNKKQITKILASQRRSYNIYYHSTYYRMQSSPEYIRAYAHSLQSVYDALSKANYPPKPKPKPHRSFWGKVGHGLASGAKAVGHGIDVAADAERRALKSSAKFVWDHRTTFLTACAVALSEAVVGGVCAVGAVISGAYDAKVDFEKGDTVAGTLDVIGVATGVGGGGLSMAGRSFGRVAARAGAQSDVAARMARAATQMGGRGAYKAAARSARAADEWANVAKGMQSTADLANKWGTALGVASTATWEGKYWFAG